MNQLHTCIFFSCFLTTLFQLNMIISFATYFWAAVSGVCAIFSLSVCPRNGYSGYLSVQSLHHTVTCCPSQFLSESFGYIEWDKPKAVQYLLQYSLSSGGEKSLESKPIASSETGTVLLFLRGDHYRLSF